MWKLNLSIEFIELFTDRRKILIYLYVTSEAHRSYNR